MPEIIKTRGVGPDKLAYYLVDNETLLESEILFWEFYDWAIGVLR